MQAGKTGKGKSSEGKKYSRNNSEEDLLDSDSLSASREDILDEGTSPRRRRKGVTEQPKKSSIYDTGYFDEEESAREVSTRARRTRKGASDTARPNLDRQTSKQSLDDLSRKDKTDAGLKRRGTKKIDAEKSKTEKKPSDVRIEDSGSSPAGAEKEEEKEDPEKVLDEKNVVFCMWGHENCRTRSHYRYNWQWDYVNKYAEQNNKHLIHGFVPKEQDQPSVRKMAQDAERAREEKEKEEKQQEGEKKPGKEGIKSRMQLLQNKFSGAKESSTLKQHVFERDLELEMLRRKKNYKHQTGGLSLSFQNISIYYDRKILI